jgi:hypothetical protein
MTSFVLDVPAMYADHHVLEVRRLLLDLPGVEAVEASSAFRAVEVALGNGTTEDDVRRVLDEAGYLAELEMPAESGNPAAGPQGDTYFRHSSAYESAGDAISFGQDVLQVGRPLWPCPGFGPPRTMQE